MGVGYYIVSKKKVAGAECETDGRAIARTPEKTVDRICAELNVTPLMDFYSCNPDDIDAFIEDLGEEPLDGPAAPEEWFDAKDGLKSVRALLDHLRENPKALRCSADVILDLEDFERVLTTLQNAKVRWHLAIDM